MRLSFPSWSVAALLACPAFVCAVAPKGDKALKPEASLTPKGSKALESKAAASEETVAGAADAAAHSDSAAHAVMHEASLTPISSKALESQAASSREAVVARAADTASRSDSTSHSVMHVKTHGTTHVQQMTVAADGSVLRSAEDSNHVHAPTLVEEEYVSLDDLITEEPSSVTRSGKELSEKGSASKKASEKEMKPTKTPPKPTEAPFPEDPTPVQQWQMAIAFSIGGLIIVTAGGLVLFFKPAEKRNAEGDLGQFSCFVAAIILGFMNNLNYAVLMGRAPALAAFYKQETWTAFFPIFMVGSCFVGTFMNAVYFLQVKFRTRIGVVCGSGALAFMILSSATGDTSIFHFLLALCACILIGSATILGELCCLSFLRDFPSVILGGFGIGTGLAAILGPAIMIGLTHGLGLPDGQIFGYLIISVIIYWLAFEHLHSKLEYVRAVYIARGERCYPPPEEPGRIVSPSSTEMLRKTSFGIITCAALAFFFEFFMYPGLVDRSDGCNNFSQFPVRHGLTVSWLSFNVGVALSRGSIAIFQIERIWVFPLLQFLNVVAVLAMRPSVLPPLAAIGWMAWIGVVGGGTYANTMRALQTWPEVPATMRELAMTVTFMMMMIAITAATLLTEYLTMIPSFKIIVSASSMSLPQGCKPVFG